ncbi:MAG: PEGA domain-containing protein [Candidatus Neomarinimicrobiota bacterium]
MKSLKAVFSFFLFVFTMSPIFVFGKTTLAVYNLKAANLLNEEEVVILSNHLTALITNSGKYDVLDRSRMSEILQEQGFQQSGCTSDACVVQAGQLLGVQKMLTGSVGRFGKLFTIELRVVDVETGRIEFSSTYYYQGEMEQLLTEGLAQGINKLFSQIPSEEREQVPIFKLPSGELIINSSQKDAQIYLNNQLIGTAPQKIEKLSSGNYSIRAKLLNYFDFDTTIYLNESEQKEITLNLKPNFGLLTILGSPIGASIFLDRIKIGAIPLHDKMLRPGNYRFVVNNKGYRSITNLVTIKSGENIIKRCELAKEVDDTSKKEQDLKTKSSEWSYKIYLNGGSIEPLGSSGTGSIFDTGMRIQGGAQLNIAKLFSLTSILQPMTLEVMGGYSRWNVKSYLNTDSYQGGKTDAISLITLYRYDLTNLILKYIDFLDPALGLFSVVGIQFNMQNWDFPNGREVDPAISFGFNLGVGIKYNLQSLVGKPVEVDLRSENGILLGIAYSF